MTTAFFTQSEKKVNIDHETICRMNAYEKDLLMHYAENGDRRILKEAANVSEWIIKQLNNK